MGMSPGILMKKMHLIADKELVEINKLTKTGKSVYKIYIGLGTLSMGILAIGVVFTVIMRYIFDISFAFVEEFMTTMFAFTTFWGIGVGIIENEHVVIDSIYNHFPLGMKRGITLFNYGVVLIINLVMVKYGLDYAIKYGSQLSMGMRIPMIWMYGIIPVGSAIGVVCVLIKLILVAKAPRSDFEYRPMN